MRGVGTTGWRSARWRGGSNGGAAVAAPPASWAPAPQALALPGMAPGMPADIADVYKWPWQGVRWSLGYVCFLVYCVGIVTYVADLGSEAMAIALLALTVGAGDRWKIPMYQWLLIGFLFVAVIGYKMTEFAQYMWAPLIDLVKVIVVGGVAASVLNDRARIRFFVFAYLAMYGLFPVRGAIFNYFIYNSTTQGRVAWNHVFSNPNDLATLMFLPIGLALGVLMTEKQKLIRLAAFAGIGMMSLAVVLTQSRGGIVALAVAAVLVVAGFKRNRLKVFVAATVVGAAVVAFAPDSVWERMSNLDTAVSGGDLRAADDQNSAAQRYELWKVAIAVSKDYPVLGVGWSAYPNANAKIGRESQFSKLASGSRDAHNTYLTLLAETGVLGTMIWLAAIFSLVSFAQRARKAMRRVLPEYAEQLKFAVIALLAYGLAGVFGSYAHWSYTYVHLGIVYAMADQGLREARLRSGDRMRSR
jgi:O-antigen ligase